MSEFTEQELDNFARYRAVQRSGRFNMLTDSPQAQRASGLTKDEYWFVLGRYSELQEAYDRRVNHE